MPRQTASPPTPTIPISIPEPLPQLDAIQSAGSGALTTPGLLEFKRLLTQAQSERALILGELKKWRAEESVATSNYRRWADGWLLRRLFKAKFQQRQELAELAAAHRTELEEQEQLSRLHTELDMPVGVVQAFHRLRDDFVQMSKAQRIWDTVGARNTNRILERTTAARAIDRQPVGFSLGRCSIVESEFDVPHLRNANGGDIFLYPAFVIYFVSTDAFALLEYREINLSCSMSRFIETEGVPSDSRVVDSAWAKANKDGSPDKRFRDNRQWPVAAYATLRFASVSGMNEEYMISHFEATSAFADAWARLVAAINAGQ